MSRAGSRGLRTSCAGLEWPSGSGTSYITARAIPPNGAGSQVRRSSIRLALRGRKLTCGQANQCPSCCVQAGASERQNRKSTAAVQARTSRGPRPFGAPIDALGVCSRVRASGGHHRRRLPSVSSSSDIGSMIRHAPRTRLTCCPAHRPTVLPVDRTRRVLETPSTVCANSACVSCPAASHLQIVRQRERDCAYRHKAAPGREHHADRVALRIVPKTELVFNATIAHAQRDARAAGSRERAPGLARLRKYRT